MVVSFCADIIARNLFFFCNFHHMKVCKEYVIKFHLQVFNTLIGPIYAPIDLIFMICILFVKKKFTFTRFGDFANMRFL